jgi:6-phosphogluconolactonase/glucosamine-6-phosphate isomerase/deaminase
VFLVSGKNKSHVLHEVLEGKKDPQRLPAQLIQGSIIWMADKAATELFIS